MTNSINHSKMLIVIKAQSRYKTKLILSGMALNAKTTVLILTGFRLAADYKLSVTLRGAGGWSGVTLCDGGT